MPVTALGADGFCCIFEEIAEENCAGRSVLLELEHDGPVDLIACLIEEKFHGLTILKNCEG